MGLCCLIRLVVDYSWGLGRLIWVCWGRMNKGVMNYLQLAAVRTNKEISSAQGGKWK
jgi:hypothetical protein